MAESARRVALIVIMVGAMASGAWAEVTEIFIPGGAFALDNAGLATYRHAGGCSSGVCFNAQGVWLPADRGVIKVGTTFWIPESWLGEEIEIILYAHSGAFVPERVRIIYDIGQLSDEELTTYVSEEDSGGGPVTLLTTRLGGPVLANQQYQGIRVGINGDHPENDWSFGILGLLVRPTGN